MPIDRRSLLKQAAVVPLATIVPRTALAAEDQASSERADYTLRIATGLVELSPDHIVSTTLYNDQFPGPLLRFKEEQRTVVDVYNDTDTPELVHWHGQMIPSDVDGAAEEGSPFVPAHGMSRIAFVPNPAVFASITPMWLRGLISTTVPIPARRGRFTSSRKKMPELTTARFFGFEGV